MRYSFWSIFIIIVGIISVYLFLSKQMDATGLFGIIFIGIGLYEVFLGHKKPISRNYIVLTITGILMIFILVLIISY